MYKKIFKRIFDVIFSFLLLPIVLFVILFFGFFIILDDGFPIIYKSKRRGLNGRVFDIYKLRTMKNNSPDIRLEDGSTFNCENDTRLTSIGKKIRKLSVDEIPQIINVFIGNMSIIGPRPSLVSMKYEELDEFRKKRLLVLPGITGYSQAYYRNSISQDKKIEYDCWYVDNISFVNDVKILFKTVEQVFIKKDIYNK